MLTGCSGERVHQWQVQHKHALNLTGTICLATKVYSTSSFSSVLVHFSDTITRYLRLDNL